MTATQTTQDRAVDLPCGMEPDPKPVPGCAHCDHLAHNRDRARANGDGSGVSDCNVRLARHFKDVHA
ncbi:hypothetical protein Sfulv_34490 [Streptomyces fulvorobeus]|uniref:Uncharacterized protein n=1 Tax=Streptomyces fulvorobeus TaxID=284028 RepID=A0A7J0C8E7_9ACTN|nr:hypothetical protein [Streptomyces fulvorobeus]GFM98638.1 hypothetical protein Sfulv_34490 [Streptomyces fulvorobeus]